MKLLIVHAYGDDIAKTLFITTTRVTFNNAKDIDLFLNKVTEILGRRIKIETVLKIMHCEDEYENLYFPLSDPEKLAIDIFSLK